MVFEYHIDSIYEQTRATSGKLTYYENDQQITKELSFRELKNQATETFNDEKWPSIEINDIEIIMRENDIQIKSPTKLNLEEFEAEEK